MGCRHGKIEGCFGRPLPYRIAKPSFWTRLKLWLFPWTRPKAITIPLGPQPIQYWFRGDRYPIHFDTITMPTFTEHPWAVRSFDINPRQVITDNATLCGPNEPRIVWPTKQGYPIAPEPRIVWPTKKAS